VTIFFYISGHGFGHAIRQIEIMRALRQAAPSSLRIVVRTSAPPWLFDRTAGGSADLRPAETDTGVVQIDSLRLDERATMESAARFYETLPAREEEEALMLREHDARLVVADAPPLACGAAAKAGVPSIVCGNFTWDWIYRDYAQATSGAAHVIATIHTLYRHASAGWRLPMHGGFDAIDTIVDVPFVARHARGDRTIDALRDDLRLSRERKLVLVSFGGYGVRHLPLAGLDCTDRWQVVVTSPGRQSGEVPSGVAGVPEDTLYERGLRYEDLVRAVDVVITKPGYGIISDCLANGAAILYTSRGRFAEYDVMVREMPRFLRSRYIALEDFLAGRWKNDLDLLMTQPAPPERPRTDGANVVAGLILKSADLPTSPQ